MRLRRLSRVSGTTGFFLQHQVHFILLLVGAGMVYLERHAEAGVNKVTGEVRMAVVCADGCREMLGCDDV